MTGWTDVPLPGLRPEPPATYSAPAVADALGIGYQRTLRWLHRLGLPAVGGGYRQHVSERQALAVLVAVRLSPSTPGGARSGLAVRPLARRAAKAVAASRHPWLFVSPGLVLHADSAEQLLSTWRAFGEPTGTVLDLDLLDDELRQRFAHRAANSG